MTAEPKKFDWLEPRKDVIYGVTDRRKDPIITKINDFLVDHSPISLKEKGLLFHSLQLMVRSGVKFTKAIYMIASRTQNIRLARILHTIHYDMEKNGLSFSAALAKHPRVFGETESKMVKSGEITGQIEQTLHSIADQIQKNLKLELEIRKALTYPIAVLIAMVLASTVVMVVVVPQFIGLFEEFETDLPLPTKILIMLSDLMVNYWWFLFLLITIGIFSARNWYVSRKGRLLFDRFLLTIPNLKEVIRNIQTYKITSHFSVLIASGIPLAKSLHILGEILTNKVIANNVFQIEDKVRQGVRLSSAFQEATDLDPVIGEIIEVGEETGHLTEALKRTSEQYEMEVDSQIKNLTTLIEPLMLLFVAVTIGFMAVAILLPIFEIGNLFGSV